jgi:hypothetical protein
LTEASITALALEESLLREWSSFHTRVERFASPAGTRAEADRTLRYVDNLRFVDSIIDALSLYLAGKSEFERRFLCYLDLVLIQRAQADDVAMLLRLADRYAQNSDLTALLGLRHRVSLYPDRPQLAPVAESCATALQRFDQPIDNITWAQAVGLEPQAETWSVSVRLGTAPADYWITRRSALKPQDVSLELLVTHPGQWRIQIARVDRLYSAQWRPAGITVDTDQPALKALSAWPTLKGHLLFPLFTAHLADFLTLQWNRHGCINAKDVNVEHARVLEWMHSCVDELQPQ